jgi:hypothetical protein
MPSTTHRLTEPQKLGILAMGDILTRSAGDVTSGDDYLYDGVAIPPMHGRTVNALENHGYMWRGASGRWYFNRIAVDAYRTLCAARDAGAAVKAREILDIVRERRAPVSTTVVTEGMEIGITEDAVTAQVIDVSSHGMATLRYPDGTSVEVAVPTIRTNIDNGNWDLIKDRWTRDEVVTPGTVVENPGGRWTVTADSHDGEVRLFPTVGNPHFTLAYPAWQFRNLMKLGSFWLPGTRTVTPAPKAVPTPVEVPVQVGDVIVAGVNVPMTVMAVTATDVEVLSWYGKDDKITKLSRPGFVALWGSTIAPVGTNCHTCGPRREASCGWCKPCDRTGDDLSIEVTEPEPVPAVPTFEEFTVSPAYVEILNRPTPPALSRTLDRTGFPVLTLDTGYGAREAAMYHSDRSDGTSYLRSIRNGR